MLNALVIPVIVMVTGCAFLATITIVLVVGHVRSRACSCGLIGYELLATAVSDNDMHTTYKVACY